MNPGCSGDPLEPALDGGEAIHLEPALAGDVDVAEQRQVGERVAVADQEVVLAEVRLEELQRVDARALRGVLGAHPAGSDEKPKSPHRRVDLGLLEEEPAMDLRPLEPVLREELAPLCEVEQDGGRFREVLDRAPARAPVSAGSG